MEFEKQNQKNQEKRNEISNLLFFSNSDKNPKSCVEMFLYAALRNPHVSLYSPDSPVKSMLFELSSFDTER